MSKKYGFMLTNEINILANLFYNLMGYTVKNGYRFDKATHPQEKMCWIFAEESYKFWRNDE